MNSLKSTINKLSFGILYLISIQNISAAEGICPGGTPIITISATSTTICNPGGSAITLTANGADTYVWSSNGTSSKWGLSSTTGSTVTALPTTTRTYTVTGTDANSCTNIATIEITVSILKVGETKANPSTICPGSSTTIKIPEKSNSYVWNPGALVGDSISVSPAVTTTYTATATSEYGCTATKEVVITVRPLPLVTVSPSNTLFCGTATSTLLSGSVTNVAPTTGAVKYSWNTGATTSTITVLPTTTTAYTLTGTDGEGCTNNATATIVVDQIPTVTASSTSSIICSGTDIILTGEGADLYSWTGEVTDGILFTPVSTATYTVTGYTAMGCSNTAAITVTVNPMPIVTAIATAINICLGEKVILKGSGANSYAWTGGVVNNVAFIPSGTETYTVIGSSNGCSNEASITVTVNANCSDPRLISSQCGQTIPDFSGSFYCTSPANAQDYEWEFSNAELGYLFTKKRGASATSIEKILITGLKPGVTYNVRVRALVGGVWGNFGSPCTITISAIIPTTKVAASQCGQTLADLSGQFYCNTVFAAQDYEWEFVNAGLGYSFTKKRGASATYIDRTLITGLKHGQSYNVRVRAMVGGVWGNFGDVCVITISATIPTTKVAASQCGQTVPDLSGSFYCNAVAGAQDYEWEFVNDDLGYSFTKKRGASANSIERILITGLKHGQAYNVRVRPLVAGTWGNFGDVCVITISATIPTTKVATSQCGQTMNLDGSFYCDIVTGAQDYEWEFVNDGLGYSFTKKRGASANYIFKSLITGLQNGVTYNVRVRVLVGGTWGDFGTVCTITINTSMGGIVVEKDPVYNNTTLIRQEKTIDSEKEYELAVFPNPSNNSGFNLNIKGMKNENQDILIDLYDMYGKHICTYSTSSIGEELIAKFNSDGELAKGVYLVNVQVNDQLLQQKVVVQ